MTSFRSKDRDISKAQRISETRSSDETNILRLVDRAAKGDVKAYGKLYDIYLDRIYRYVFYHVKDKMTAEDLTQEIFMKAWGAIGKYEWKGQPFSSWLFRIAHNHTIDFYRSTRRSAKLEEQISVGIIDPEQKAEDKFMQEELLRAISYLTSQQREAIILKFIEGLDNHQIAQITGKSEGAIRVAQMRALTALRHRLVER